ncbi:hypothetical protein HPP92_007420 [Vanilla planifolia]|uniref:Serine/threonine-protein phosphatase 2A 55 kDa regulatory subunit B n=1 Tax=Vanilla planifolia TaxID=51239 RepID=A0A835RR53_VANPL|nr:hypothetical protein HPP92_007420 [Vanilla planifolia]
MKGRLGVASVPPPLEWKFSQVFGERATGEEVQEVDVISAIEFDKSGNHLATGDRGGRVVLFERTDVKEHGSRKDLEKLDFGIYRHPEFRYKTEFQSHEPEVQEKKVKRISEMNAVHSLAGGNESIPSSTTASSGVFLPNGECTNRSHKCLNNGFNYSLGEFPALCLPLVAASQETSLVARCRRVYAYAHDYHINSISNNSDGETFISADDLRINLWNLEISSQSFNIVDLKPANMEDLTEVITSAEFHPSHCNTLAYSSSKGSIRLIDLRQSALCDNHSKLLEEREAPGSSNLLRVFGCAAQSTEATTLEATKNPMRKQVQTPARPVRSLANLSRVVKRALDVEEQHLKFSLEKAFCFFVQLLEGAAG